MEWLRLLAFAAAVANSGAATALECSDSVVTALTDPPAAFTVELALTPEEQSQGLMFRPQLPRESGMLFVMEPPRPARFWMRNTMISLDLIFIDRDGRVESIAADAIPYSERTMSSHDDVRAVLEINGGLSAELGIVPGTQMIHPSFDEAPAEHRCAE
ncbi:MAG: DUF192 domain-containing protein [Pseudomonadota bacterium]